jgi:hypothetical protein
MEFAPMARHGPRRRTIHEFGDKAEYLPEESSGGRKFVDGPPSRTMTTEAKRESIHRSDGHMGPRQGAEAAASLPLNIRRRSQYSPADEPNHTEQP